MDEKKQLLTVKDTTTYLIEAIDLDLKIGIR